MSTADDGWGWLTQDDEPQHDLPDYADEDWVAYFDSNDPDNVREVTFQPADVDGDKICTEWITVELGHGTICHTEDYR